VRLCVCFRVCLLMFALAGCVRCQRRSHTRIDKTLDFPTGTCNVWKMYQMVNYSEDLFDRISIQWPAGRTEMQLNVFIQKHCAHIRCLN